MPMRRACASMRPEGFPPGKLVHFETALEICLGTLLASMRPEGFPPGKSSCRRARPDPGRGASMRPEGFPPGKPPRRRCDRPASPRRGFNEAGRFPPRKIRRCAAARNRRTSALASMRPEGFPPGKTKRRASGSVASRLTRASMRPEGFPPGKTWRGRRGARTWPALASMRPEGFPPGKGPRPTHGGRRISRSGRESWAEDR